MTTNLFQQFESRLKEFGHVDGLEAFVRLVISKSYDKGWQDAKAL